MINVVRQGAVSFPIIFNSYASNLFDILKSSGADCTISGHYFGLFAYAANLLSFCPSIIRLKKRHNITEEFAVMHPMSQTLLNSESEPRRLERNSLEIKGRQKKHMETVKHTER